MSDTIVSLRNVCKQFGSVVALDDVSIDIQQGEIFALLGPSGCGKSTLLRIISGFESLSQGELLLDGQDLTSLPPNKRPINMVFQSYAVFPHMSVEDNVAYGLKMDKVPAGQRGERVATALEQVHLLDFAKRMPDQLSGGQRQRVALARALIKRPRVLLLDEPLSALDAKLRDAMRLELVKLQETVGITFVIVTHDQSEAMAMADRIAILESGKLRQVASPEELYAHPVDAFVADFIGQINAFTIQDCREDGEKVSIQADHLSSFKLDRSRVNLPDTAYTEKAGIDAVAAVRPEHVSLSLAPPAEATIKVAGTLGDIAFQGQHCIAEVLLPGDRSITAIIGTQHARSMPCASEQVPVWAYWQPEDMLLLPRNATT